MKKKTKETGILLSEQTEEVAYHIQVRKSFWTKVRYGTAAVVFTALFLAFAIGLNVLVGLLSERYRLQADLTEKQTFRVSDTTVNYLEGLQEKVELILLGDEQSWREYSVTAQTTSETGAGLSVSLQKYIVETLDRYNEASGNVSLYFVNPLFNPGFFKARQNLPVTDDSGNKPVVIVYSPETHRYSYLPQSLFDGDVQYLVLENRLNTAIRYVTNPNMQKIAILNGHGEDDLTTFANVMHYAYEFELLNLNDVQAIPDDYFMLIISDPSEPYSASDIRKIDAFLSNGEALGKHLIVCAGTEYSSSDTALRGYLEEWGISLQDQVIFDPQHTLTIDGKTPMFTVNYSEDASAMTNRLAENEFKLKFELSRTRPLKKLFDSQRNIRVYSLLHTYDDAFARAPSGDTVIDSNRLGTVRKEAGDASGPFDVGLMALKTRYDGQDEYNSTVTVFGADSLVNSYFISNVDYENNATQEYAAQLIHFTVSQSEELFEYIPTVSLLTNVLTFESNSQIIMVYLCTVALIPLAFFGIGFAVWRKRKYL